MKKPLILASFCINCIFTFAQKAEETPPIDAGKEETNKFYYFEIPSAINGSSLDPSPISSATINFTESKASLKLGFPTLLGGSDDLENLTYTGFIQANFKASNGVSTLYKSDNPPFEGGITAGISRILSHRYWNHINTTKQSSEAITWLNMIGNIEKTNYNIFTSNGSYGMLNEKVRGETGSLFVSINGYFHSEIAEYKWRRLIASLGIGYAKTNNYASLKKRTLEDGILVYNENNTAYQSVVEATSGAIGKFKSYEGLASYGELFIPIVKGKKSRKYGSLYWGTRATYYGIGKKQYIINGNTGFYINLKDGKTTDDVKNPKPAKDIVSFSITGQFNQINYLKQSEYFKDNFSIVLQVGIPLRFN